MRPYAYEIANKMDPEVWVHHYDLENKRVAPENPEIVNFGRPSQDPAGVFSSYAGPSSSLLAAPVQSAEPTLKTPAAPTPSRAVSGDAQKQAELATHMKSPKGTGFQTKRVATKPPLKPAPPSAAQAQGKSPVKKGSSTPAVQTKDKSPAKKDSPTLAKESAPVKDNSLDDSSL